MDLNIKISKNYKSRKYRKKTKKQSYLISYHVRSRKFGIVQGLYMLTIKNHKIAVALVENLPKVDNNFTDNRNLKHLNEVFISVRHPTRMLQDCEVVLFERIESVGALVNDLRNFFVLLRHDAYL